MLKKTAAAGGLLITAAAGALVTCSPALAAPVSAPAHMVMDHNRNWSGNENTGLTRIRLRIHNRNNNIAVARTRRPERREGQYVGAPGGGGAPIVGAPGA